MIIPRLHRVSGVSKPLQSSSGSQTQNIFLDYLSGKSSKIIIQDFASRFYFSLDMGEFHPFNSHAKHPFLSGCFLGGKCRIKFIFGIQRHTSRVSAWKAKFQTIISTSRTNVASPNADHKTSLLQQHHLQATSCKCHVDPD